MAIDREIRFITSGTKNSRSQVFFNNYLADSTPVRTPFFSFEKPMWYTFGGTLSYYSQDPYAIFTSLVRPPIRFVFTANTASLSGDSYLVHEIYRLDYDTYKLYSDNQIDNNPQISNKLVSDTKNVNPDNPQPTRNAPNKDIIVNPQSLKSGNNIIPQPEKFFGQRLTPTDFSTIQQYFENPIITVTASTSAITGNIYDLFLDQYVKQTGKYKTELFTDKGQYLINTSIVFDINLNKDYSEFFKNAQELIEEQGVWSDSLSISATNAVLHSIKSGPFKDIQVIGNYFCYFIVPDKPKLEYPIAQGTLTTFTPEFRWSNGGNADSFLIRINYNTGDTGFTGTFFSYPVEKTEKNTHISTSTNDDMSGNSFSSQKNIYTFQVPVKSNSPFIYQIGNSKEMIDIFNIRRNVITFSDTYMAISQPEPIQIYVETESDSDAESSVSGGVIPPSLDYESAIENYILSGVVSGSTITGATMVLTYPNSNFATINTDLTGYYSFDSLEPGVYTLTTSYRGYQQDIRMINITGNTSLGFKVNLLWGNAYDTWGELANESYYT